MSALSTLKRFKTQVLFVVTVSGIAVPCQAQTAGFDGRNMFVHIPERAIESAAVRFLNQRVAGTIKSTETQRVSVRNFRVWLGNGNIRVVFDYNAKRRGFTDLPFRGKLYTPWASVSGWAEVKIRLGVRRNRFYAYAERSSVRWSSNNWVVDKVLRPFIDGDFCTEVANGVNNGIYSFLGTQDLDLRRELHRRGTPILASRTRLSHEQASRALVWAVNNVRIGAQVTPQRVSAWIDLQRVLPR